MRDSTRVTKRIKGALPDGTIVMHRSGTSDTDNGITHATNDIGLILLPDGRYLAIAVFVTDSPADEVTREEAIAQITRVVFDSVK
jgi:beta-lactamase class A